MTNERRYQLQSEEANARIDELLTQLGVPPETRRSYGEMLTTVLKMFEDGADLGDLKIANAALKELRYGFKVFAPYRDFPKVTVFGSARLLPDNPITIQAHTFGARMVEAGWMVITGAGDGVMAAAQNGAGREKSFGLNIRLPWEQEANPVIADDPKLINFKYFFIRKLFFLKETDAVCLFPGGFGTSDEAFEALTLIQTGKTPLIPVVLLDEPGGQFWKAWEAFIGHEMVDRGMISADDLHLFRLTDDVSVAAREVLDFYRVFHSQRAVGDQLVLRLRRPLTAAALSALEAQFEDVLKGRAWQLPGPLPQEGGELPDLPRLVLPVVRSNYGRLRLLIDAINLSEFPHGRA
ncbi:MAG: LOG family protein [Candidatus Rokubacteria bacterium]|nr:LOG family protein [Candidatus Rokubacteria bacterium]